MTSFDLDSVRRCFPALADGFAYFDNAGGSLTLESVAARVSDYLLRTDVQLGASYEVSAKASARVQEAREAIALLMNAATPEEVVLGPSTTVLLGFLAEAMRPSIEPGDEIVVTRADHEANIGCWTRLAEKTGATLRFWDPDPETHDLHPEALDDLLTDRTRLVCFTHVSNIFGRLHPVAEITKRAHAAGAEVCVDGVAYAPHRAIDVRAWDVDYYAFSLYKVYGPHHAVLYGKRDRMLELDSINHFFVEKDRIPGKLEPGNVNYELTWASGAVTEYVAGLGGADASADPAAMREAVVRGFDAIAAHEQAIGGRLLDYLRGRADVRIVGPDTDDASVRVPTISFVVEGRRSSEIVERVDPYGIGIRFGDFYARRLIDWLGLGEQDGVIRASMVHYNSFEEVDRLIAALDEVLGG